MRNDASARRRWFRFPPHLISALQSDDALPSLLIIAKVNNPPPTAHHPPPASVLQLRVEVGQSIEFLNRWKISTVGEGLLRGRRWRSARHLWAAGRVGSIAIHPAPPSVSKRMCERVQLNRHLHDGRRWTSAASSASAPPSIPDI